MIGFMAALCVGDLAIDDTLVRKSGFRMIAHDHVPTEDRLSLQRIYRRDADKATLSFNVRVGRSDAYGAEALERFKSMMANRLSDRRLPLPSGKSIGRDWRIYPRPGGGTTQLHVFDGHIVISVHLHSPGVLGRARADRAAVESIARVLLASARRQYPRP